MMDAARNVVSKAPRYWRLILGLNVLILLFYITPLPATKQPYSSCSVEKAF